MLTRQDRTWLEARRYTSVQLALARGVLEEIRSGASLEQALHRHPLPGGGLLPKHLLVHAYRTLTASGEWRHDPDVLRAIRMKPIRTLSGVTTVSVLTKPYPCPGQCIFCPSERRMPKSYLPDEPGARRARQHEFDPYRQTASRLEAIEAIGHPTDKIELIILGGTWSAYPPDYREWFIRRCLDALNGFDSSGLEEAQRANQTARRRNVGLVVETRPDCIDLPELARLRALGVTKVQLGAQSLDDRLLALNRRGHDVAATRRAVSLLRAAGFKVVLHWMPNLLGATPESDRQDFARLWDDPGLRPDEIKIYPCLLLESAALMDFWRRGQYQPYSTATLIELIADLKPSIPRYCRVNRVVRDIPSTCVLAGNRRTSLRQDIQAELARRGEACSCIRCREVREQVVETSRLRLGDLSYDAGGAEEHFLSFDTADDRLAGYLRLSLPGPDSPATGLADLHGAALVRDVHVFGESLALGTEAPGAAQHAGLGQRLMQHAEGLAQERGYRRIAVIAALGTRAYYASLGYCLGETYMIKNLPARSGQNRVN